MREKVLRNALLGTVVLGVVTGCSTAPPRPSGEVAVTSDINTGTLQEGVVPRREPASSRGNPDSYVVFGKRYYVMGSSEGYRQRGTASWYGPGFHGRKTSSGTIYNMYGVSAAHKQLPIPTYARVTHLGNGRSIIVRIDDRGPFVGDRLIDLSYGAATKLGMIGEGTASVEVEALSPYQYLPGFAPGQMLAKADRYNNGNGPRLTAFSFTQSPAPAAGSADASRPSTTTFRLSAPPPAPAAGSADVSRLSTVTFRLSAPEIHRNQPVVAASPRSSTPPSLTPAAASPPPHSDNPPVLTPAPVGAAAAVTANKVARVESTRSADRDAFSFSDHLATGERQTAATPFGQPPVVTASTAIASATPAGQPPAVATPTAMTLTTLRPSRFPVAPSQPVAAVAVRPTAIAGTPRLEPEPAAERAKAERGAATQPESRLSRAADKTPAVDNKFATRTRTVAVVNPEKPKATVKSVAANPSAKPKAADKASADERITAATTPVKPAATTAKVDKGQAGNRTVTAADNSHLYLQVGAFTQRGNAEDLRNRLAKALRYGVRINPGKNNLHTVRVGPLNDPVEASRLKGRLANLGISTPHVVFE